VAITVFVWNPSVDAYGHAAMQIAGGPYISWWPSIDLPTISGILTNSMFGSYAYVNTMAEDQGAEKRPPSWASAPITCLDEQAISSWWKKFSGNPRNSGGYQSLGKYNVLTTSCSGVVYTALLEGGLRRHPMAFAVSANVGAIVSPADVKDVASALSGELGTRSTAKYLQMTAIDYLSPGQIPVGGAISDLRDAVKYFGKK